MPYRLAASHTTSTATAVITGLGLVTANVSAQAARLGQNDLLAWGTFVTTVGFALGGLYRNYLTGTEHSRDRELIAQKTLAENRESDRLREAAESNARYADLLSRYLALKASTEKNKTSSAINRAEIGAVKTDVGEVKTDVAAIKTVVGENTSHIDELKAAEAVRERSGSDAEPRVP